MRYIKYIFYLLLILFLYISFAVYSFLNFDYEKEIQIYLKKNLQIPNFTYQNYFIETYPDSIINITNFISDNIKSNNIKINIPIWSILCFNIKFEKLEFSDLYYIIQNDLNYNEDLLFKQLINLPNVEVISEFIINYNDYQIELKSFSKIENKVKFLYEGEYFIIDLNEDNIIIQTLTNDKIKLSHDNKVDFIKKEILNKNSESKNLDYIDLKDQYSDIKQLNTQENDKNTEQNKIIQINYFNKLEIKYLIQLDFNLGFEENYNKNSLNIDTSKSFFDSSVIINNKTETISDSSDLNKIKNKQDNNMFSNSVLSNSPSNIQNSTNVENTIETSVNDQIINEVNNQESLNNIEDFDLNDINDEKSKINIPNYLSEFLVDDNNELKNEYEINISSNIEVSNETLSLPNINIRSDFMNGDGSIEILKDKYAQFYFKDLNLSILANDINIAYLKFLLIDDMKISIKIDKLIYQNIILSNVKIIGSIQEEKMNIEIYGIISEVDLKFSVKGIIYYNDFSQNYNKLMLNIQNIDFDSLNNAKLQENISFNKSNQNKSQLNYKPNINSNLDPSIQKSTTNIAVIQNNKQYNNTKANEKIKYLNKEVLFDLNADIVYDQFGFSLEKINLLINKAKITGFIDYKTIGNQFILETNLKGDKLVINKEILPKFFNILDEIDQDKSNLFNFLKNIKMLKYLTRHQIKLNNLIYNDKFINQLKFDVNSYNGILDSNDFYLKYNDNIFISDILFILNQEIPKISLEMQDGFLDLKLEQIYYFLNQISAFDTKIQANLNEFIINNINYEDLDLEFKLKQGQLLIKALNFAKNKTKTNLFGYVLLSPLNMNIKYNIENLKLQKILNINDLDGDININGKFITYGENIDELIYNTKSKINFESKEIALKQFNIDNLISKIRNYKQNLEQEQVIKLKNYLYVENGKLQNLSGLITLNKGVLTSNLLMFNTLQSSGKMDLYYNIYTKDLSLSTLINFYLDVDVSTIYSINMFTEYKNKKTNFRIEYLDNFNNFFKEK